MSPERPSLCHEFLLTFFPNGIIFFLCKELCLQVGQQWKCRPWQTVISAGNRSRNARKPVFPPPSLADTCAVKNAGAAPDKDSSLVWPELCEEQRMVFGVFVSGDGESFSCRLPRWTPPRCPNRASRRWFHSELPVGGAAAIEDSAGTACAPKKRCLTAWAVSVLHRSLHNRKGSERACMHRYVSFYFRYHY